MIKIIRSRCPKLLKKSNINKTYYNKSKIVEVLWKMQFEKCCYCEQKLSENGHIKAVEHFRPKSIFKSLKNNWPNLLLACAQCNGHKSDKFPIQLCNNKNQPKIIWLKKDSRNRNLLNKKGKLLIVNPADPKVFPENELDYNLDDSFEDWGQIIHRSDIGEMTIKIIDLTNPFHVKKRRAVYRETLYPALLNLSRAYDSKDLVQMRIRKDAFEDILKSDHEFAGFARAFARYKKLDANYNINIPI